MKKEIKSAAKTVKQPIVYSTEGRMKMNFNWKQIKKQYKNDKEGLDRFIASTKEDISKNLIIETKRRKMVPNLARKCASQSCFNQVIRGQDDVWGELLEVMATTVNRWEKYCREIVDNNKKMQHASQKGSLRMDDENDILGYYRNSVSNAFADLFIHHKAQKRAAPEVNFSSLLTKNDEENEKNYEDGIVCPNNNKNSFNQNKAEMIKTLKAYDKKSGRKTKFARVFVALMNPRYNGAVTVIQGKLKMNNKNFNEAKEGIAFILREQFGDVRKEIIDFLDNSRGLFDELEQGNKASRQYENRKELKAIEKLTPKPCRTNIIFGQKMHPTKPNQWIYYGFVQVQRSKTPKIIAYSPDNWDQIFYKEEQIEGKGNQNTKIKPKLEKMLKKAIEEAEKISRSNGNLIITPSTEIEDPIAA
jgi:hypothetical protein